MGKNSESQILSNCVALLNQVTVQGPDNAEILVECRAYLVDLQVKAARDEVLAQFSGEKHA